MRGGFLGNIMCPSLPSIYGVSVCRLVETECTITKQGSGLNGKN